MQVIPRAIIFTLSLAIQQAAAINWLDAQPFPCPSNTNNQCSDSQQGGFNWDGLASGSFSSYGGLQFSGFSKSDSFSKRHVLSSRDTQSSCIQGSVGTNPGNSPKISYDSGKSFSITNLQVSVSFDTELDFIYGYENGATCNHTAFCSASGTPISNSQCGGATSVTFQLPDTSEQSNCSVGIHSIGFDCGPASSTVIKQKSATSLPMSSNVASALSGSSWPTQYGNLTINSVGPTSAGPTSAAPTISPSSVGLPPLALGANSSTSIVYTTKVVTVPGCASTVKNCPLRSSTVVTSVIPLYTTICPLSSGLPSAGPSSIPIGPSLYPSASAFNSSVASPTQISSVPAPGSTQEVVTTEIILTTTTVCPITNTVTSGSSQILQVTSSVSTVLSTSISTICTKCVAPTPAPPSPTQTSSIPAPGSTQEVVTTEVVLTTTTVCPVTNTLTSGTSQVLQVTSSVSTVFITSTSTICTKCVAPTPAPPSSSSVPPISASAVSYSPSASSLPVGLNSTAPASSIPESAISTSSSVPVPSAPCPDVVPRCLQSWLYETGCDNNAHAECYCLLSNFTTNVINCVSSWAKDDMEIQAGLSYFVGICAPHVNKNPGIITAIPSSITLCPTPAPATPSPSALSSAPPLSNATTSSIANSPTTASSPVPSPQGTTQEIVTTEIVMTTVTSCPVTNTITSGNTHVVVTTNSISTIYTTSTSTICTKCIAPPVSTPPAQSGPSSSSQITPTSSPNTISTTVVPSSPSDLSVVSASSNSVTSNVPISSPAANATQASSANTTPPTPTNVPPEAPTTVVPPVATTLAPTAPPQSSVPATTITIATTLSNPCTYSTGVSSGQTIPSSYALSTLSTQVTVPQVQFTTQSAGSGASGSPSVGLAAGIPNNAAATATSAYTAGVTTFASAVGSTKPKGSKTMSAFEGKATGLGAPAMVAAVVLGAVGVAVGF